MEKLFKSHLTLMYYQSLVFTYQSHYLFYAITYSTIDETIYINQKKKKNIVSKHTLSQNDIGITQ